jgi:hypothetical protein
MTPPNTTEDTADQRRALMEALTTPTTLSRNHAIALAAAVYKNGYNDGWDACWVSHHPLTTDRGRASTHPYAGQSKQRAETGLPGHCERCALVGHVKAHPSLGCGDVGCTKGHDE